MEHTVTTNREKITLFRTGTSNCYQEDMDTTVSIDENHDIESGKFAHSSDETSYYCCVDVEPASNSYVSLQKSNDHYHDDSDQEQDARRECELLLACKHNGTKHYTTSTNTPTDNNSKHKINKHTESSSSPTCCSSSDSNIDGFCNDDDDGSYCNHESCVATATSEATSNSSRSIPFFLAAAIGRNRNHDDKRNDSRNATKTDNSDTSSLLYRRQKRNAYNLNNFLVNTNNSVKMEKEQTKRSDNKRFGCGLSYYHIQLLYGTIGIYASYMCYGIVHEQLFTYRNSNGTGFVFVWFLQVVESAVTIMIACIGHRLQLSMSRVMSTVATGSVNDDDDDDDSVVVKLLQEPEPEQEQEQQQQENDSDSKVSTSSVMIPNEEDDNENDDDDKIETSNRTLTHNSLNVNTTKTAPAECNNTSRGVTATAAKEKEEEEEEEEVAAVATTTTCNNNRNNSKNSNMPLIPFYKAGTSQLLAKVCMNLALSYGHVPFPIVVLTKSAKIIPVMIGQIILGGTSFTMKEYWFASCMVIGTILLGLNSTTTTSPTPSTTADVYDNEDDDNHDNNPDHAFKLYGGYFFLFLSILFDGVTGGIQKRIKNELVYWKPTSYDFLYHSHCSMLFVSFVLCCFVRHDVYHPVTTTSTATTTIDDGTTTAFHYTNHDERHLFLSSSSSSSTTLSSLYNYYSSYELLSALTYCYNNMTLVYHTILPMSICSAIGQGFIFYIISVFCPFVNAAITSSRKVFTVLISLLYVGNTTFTDPIYGMFGLCFAFVPVVYEGIIHPFCYIVNEVLSRG